MKATISTTVTLVLVFAGTAPAADPRLVNLVMSDATVIADVNVAQAKTTPFGQYVLTLIAPHDKELQTLATLTGFDPRQDVNELLVATNGGAGSNVGLALASGTFNVSAILTAATAAGAVTETYQGVTLVESPNGSQGFAFLNASIGAIGDVASVKGAIDRQASSGAHLSSTIVSEINQLSGSNDAWVLTTVPLSSLQPPTGAPTINGLNLQALQQIQAASAGVSFGANVTVTAQAQMNTAQNATTLAGMVQLLANMAQMQAQKAPAAAALAKSLTATASGSTVTVSFSMAEAQVQQLIQQAGQNKAKVEPKKR